jgi:hypothetical protein
MLYVKIRRAGSVDTTYIDTTKPLRCYIHEVEGDESNKFSHWFLVESKKDQVPYNSDGSGAKRKFVDPDFCGFMKDGSVPRKMKMYWLDGNQVEIVEAHNNEAASYLLLKDEDYIKID